MAQDSIGEKIRNMLDIEAPDGMHERIMKKIARTHLRTPFLIILALLGANFVLSAWHVWARMVQLETLSIFRALMEGFTLTTDFMEDATATMPQFLPLSSLAVFAINLTLVAYGIYFYRGVKRMTIG